VACSPGKFDQYKRDIPYGTLAQTFQSLVCSLLRQSEAELGQWRDSLSEALGPNGRLIVNLVPELELVIGKQPPVPDLPPQEAQDRFQMVFRRFLGVFAREEHPLALFLDDLQWLDVATLDLLEHLVTHSDVRHLLLVGAYRDNEVSPSHSLLRTLDAIRKAGAFVQEISLAPLFHEDLERLIADTLSCAPDDATPLARLVHEKTGGSPFFEAEIDRPTDDQGKQVRIRLQAAHDPRSEARHCRRARLSPTSGHRLVAASDGRRSATGIRSDLVAAREPHDRGSDRAAFDERPGLPRDAGMF
jgi:predicted ATPase